MLQGRQRQNKEVVQRNITVPPFLPHTTYTPPYPTVSGLDLLHSFHDGGDILLPDPFPQPIRIRPKSDADHLAMERLIADEYRKGWVVVLPKHETEQLCRDQALRSAISPSFISRKTDSDPVKEEMGRRTDDYSVSGMNTPAKRRQLAHITGPYDDPSEADICQIILDAVDTYPGQPVWLLKSDYPSYFRRFPIKVEHALMLAIHLIISGVEYMVIPLFGPFGLQDSNAVAKCATEAMHAMNVQYHMQLHGKVLQTTFLDDTVAASPHAVLHRILSWITTTANNVIGPNGIATKKTFIDRIMVVLGFQYNCNDMTISITTTWYEKLVSVLFDDLPVNPATGDKVLLRVIQRVAAHMLRTARLTTSMLSYSRALYRNIRGVVDHDYAVVYLTERSVVDILTWRQFVLHCFYDANALRVPITIPVLVTRRRGESKEDFWSRQAASAHNILHVDACTNRPELLPRDCWGAGWISSPSHKGAADAQPIPASDKDSPSHKGAADAQPIPASDKELPILPTPTAYGAYEIDRLDIGGLPIKLKDQINIYEFLAALIALTALSLQGRPDYVPEGEKWHVHIWTDNTSALAWLTSHKSSHPLIIHLLHIFSSIQERYNMLVTMGHIPGKINTLADAASRGFQTPEGYQSFQKLCHLVPHTQLPEWWCEIPRG